MNHVTANDAKWNSAFETFVSFCFCDGQMPTANEPGDRGKSAKWAARQRSHAKKGVLRVDRLGRLNDAVPGWRYTVKSDAHKLRIAQNITAFYDCHGVPPRQRTDNDIEHRLGRQLSNLRKDTSLPADAANWLDSHMPDWRTERTGIEVWREKIRRLAIYYAVMGKCPPRSQPLGQFAVELRKDRTHLTAEQLSYLREHLPRWWDARGEDLQFISRGSELQEFVSFFDQLPNKNSRDDSARSLGEFLWRQRKKDKEGRLSPAREAFLDEFVPGWRGVHQTSRDYRAIIYGLARAA